MNKLMKILEVASNGALVKQGGKIELRPRETFITPAQQRHIQVNHEYERAVLAKIRSSLEAKIN